MKRQTTSKCETSDLGFICTRI